MKRLNYDGQSLVTGTAVAQAIIEYAGNVARMGTSMTVEIPVLEANGTIGRHALLLNQATALETFDVDGDLEDESNRFPVPEFTGVGGKAIPVSGDGLADISVPIAE